MSVTTPDIWHTVLKTVGVNENIDLLSMHLNEIEEEAENVLDLLTVLRSDAYHSDRDSAQESAAELAITSIHPISVLTHPSFQSAATRPPPACGCAL